MANPIINIGVAFDLKRPLRELEAELDKASQEGLDLGVSKSAEKEINNLKKTVQGLSEAIDKINNKELGSAGVAQLEKDFNAKIQSMTERTQELQNCMSALMSTMSNAQKEQVSKTLENITEKTNEAIQTTNQLTDSISSVNKAANKGTPIKLDLGYTKQYVHELEEISKGLEKIDNYEGAKLDNLSAEKAKEQLEELIVSYLNFKKQLEKSKPGSDEFNGLQKNIAETSLMIQRLNEDLYESIADDKNLNKIFRNKIDIGNNTKKFADDIIEDIKKETDHILKDLNNQIENIKKSAGSLSGNDKEGYKIPIVLGTTKSDFLNKVLDIINFVRKNIKDEKIEVGISLVTEWGSRKLKEQFKEFSEKVQSISKETGSEEIKAIYDDITKYFNDEITIKIKSDIDKVAPEIIDWIDTIRNNIKKDPLKLDLDAPVEKTEETAKAQEKVSKYANKTEEELQKCLKTETRYRDACNDNSDNWKKHQANIDEINECLINLEKKEEKINKPLKIYDESVLSGLTELAKKLEDISKSSRPISEDLLSIQETLDKLSVGGVTKATDSVEKLEADFEKIKQDLLEINGGIRQKTNLTKIQNAFKSYRDYLDRGGKRNYTELSDNENIQKWFNTHLKNVLKTSANEYRESGRNVGLQFAEGITESIGEIVGAVTEMVNVALNTIQIVQDSASPSKKTYELGWDFVAGYAEGIHDGIKDVKKAAGEIADSGLKELVDKQKEESDSSAIADKVENVAESVIEAANKGAAQAQKSHSPSKVAEKLGEYWGEGYAKGIRKHAKDVEQSIRELVNSGKLTVEDLQEDLNNLQAGNFGNRYKQLGTPLQNILADNKSTDIIDRYKAKVNEVVPELITNFKNLGEEAKNVIRKIQDDNLEGLKNDILEVDDAVDKLANAFYNLEESQKKSMKRSLVTEADKTAEKQKKHDTKEQTQALAEEEKQAKKTVQAENEVTKARKQDNATDEIVESEGKFLPIVVETNEEMQKRLAIHKAFLDSIGQSDQAKREREIAGILQEQIEKKKELENTPISSDINEIIEGQNKIQSELEETSQKANELDQIFVHLGSTTFDKDKYEKPFTDEFRMQYDNKPICGLWASPYGKENEWKDLALKDGYNTAENLAKQFAFKFKDTAKVLIIKSIEDLSNLPLYSWQPSFNENTLYDWDLLAEQYDGIFVKISEDKERLDKELTGWDIDSVVVTNPDAIEQIELETQAAITDAQAQRDLADAKKEANTQSNQKSVSSSIKEEISAVEKFDNELKEVGQQGTTSADLIAQGMREAASEIRNTTDEIEKQKEVLKNSIGIGATLGHTGLSDVGVALKENIGDQLSNILIDTYFKRKGSSINYDNFDPSKLDFSKEEKEYFDFSKKYYNQIHEAVVKSIHKLLSSNLSDKDFGNEVAEQLKKSISNSELVNIVDEYKDAFTRAIQDIFNSISSNQIKDDNLINSIVSSKMQEVSNNILSNESITLDNDIIIEKQNELQKELKETEQQAKKTSSAIKEIRVWLKDENTDAIINELVPSKYADLVNGKVFQNRNDMQDTMMALSRGSKFALEHGLAAPKDLTDAIKKIEALEDYNQLLEKKNQLEKQSNQAPVSSDPVESLLKQYDELLSKNNELWQKVNAGDESLKQDANKAAMALTDVEDKLIEMGLILTGEGWVSGDEIFDDLDQSLVKEEKQLKDDTEAVKQFIQAINLIKGSKIYDSYENVDDVINKYAEQIKSGTISVKDALSTFTDNSPFTIAQQQADATQEVTEVLAKEEKQAEETKEAVEKLNDEVNKPVEQKTNLREGFKKLQEFTKNGSKDTATIVSQFIKYQEKNGKRPLSDLTKDEAKLKELTAEYERQTQAVKEDKAAVEALSDARQEDTSTLGISDDEMSVYAQWAKENEQIEEALEQDAPAIDKITEGIQGATKAADGLLEKLEKLPEIVQGGTNPIDAKYWRGLDRIAQIGTHEDFRRDTKKWENEKKFTEKQIADASNILKLAGDFQQSGQTSYLKELYNAVDTAEISGKMKNALKANIRKIVDEIQNGAKEAVDETVKEKKPTKTVTMSRQKYKEYVKQQGIIADNEAFNYNFNLHLEGLKRKGLAEQLPTKSGKGGKWVIKVEVEDDEAKQNIQEIAELTEKELKDLTAQEHEFVDGLTPTMSEDEIKADIAKANAIERVTEAQKEKIKQQEALNQAEREFVDSITPTMTDEEIKQDIAKADAMEVLAEAQRKQAEAKKETDTQIIPDDQAKEIELTAEETERLAKAERDFVDSLNPHLAGEEAKREAEIAKAIKEVGVETQKFEQGEPLSFGNVEKQTEQIKQEKQEVDKLNQGFEKLKSLVADEGNFNLSKNQSKSRLQKYVDQFIKYKDQNGDKELSDLTDNPKALTKLQKEYERQIALRQKAAEVEQKVRDKQTKTVDQTKQEASEKKKETAVEEQNRSAKEKTAQQTKEATQETKKQKEATKQTTKAVSDAAKAEKEHADAIKKANEETSKVKPESSKVFDFSDLTSDKPVEKIKETREEAEKTESVFQNLVDTIKSLSNYDNKSLGRKEQAVYANLVTGKTSQIETSKYDNAVTGKLSRELLQTVVGEVDTFIHSHPESLASFSPQDIKALFNRAKDGITKALVVSFDEVASFDASKINAKDFDGIFNSFLSKLVEETNQLEQLTMSQLTDITASINSKDKKLLGDVVSDNINVALQKTFEAYQVDKKLAPEVVNALQEKLEDKAREYINSIGLSETVNPGTITEGLSSELKDIIGTQIQGDAFEKLFKSFKNSLYNQIRRMFTEANSALDDNFRNKIQMLVRDILSQSLSSHGYKVDDIYKVAKVDDYTAQLLSSKQQPKTSKKDIQDKKEEVKATEQQVKAEKELEKAKKQTTTAEKESSKAKETTTVKAKEAAKQTQEQTKAEKNLNTTRSQTKKDNGANASAQGAEKEAKSLGKVTKSANDAAKAKEAFSEANREVLDSIIESLNGLKNEGNAFANLSKLINSLGGKNGAEKLEATRNGIQEIINALSVNVDNNSLIDVLHKITENGSNLADIATILRASKKNIEDALNVKDTSDIDDLLNNDIQKIVENVKGALQELGGEGSSIINIFDVTKTRDGFLEIVGLIKTADEKLQQFTLHTKDGLEFQNVGMKENTAQMAKQMKMYAQVEEYMNRMKQKGEMLSDRVFINPDFEPEVWEQMLSYVEEYRDYLGEIKSITLQTRQDTTGEKRLESWSVNGKNGNHVTVGPTGNVVASHQDILSTDELIKKINHLISKRKEYNELLDKRVNGNWSAQDIANLNALDAEYQEVIESVERLNRLVGDNEAAQRLNQFNADMTTDFNKTLTKFADSSGKKIENALKTKNNQLTAYVTEYSDKIKDAQQNIKIFYEVIKNHPANTAYSDEERQKIQEMANQVSGVTKELNNLGNVYQPLGDVDKLISKISTDLNDNTAMSGKLRRAFKSLRDEVKTLRGDADGTESSLSQIDKITFKRLAQQFNTLHSQMIETKQTGDSLFGSLAKAAKNQSVQFLARYLSFYDLIRYFRTAYNAIDELDYALVDLRKTTTMNAEELNNFYINSTKVAKEMGVTTKEIIDQASSWSRLGYSSNEAATEMAALSSKFAAISPGMSTEQAQTGLVSIMKAWDIDVSEVERRIMDNINTLGRFAQTYSNIGNHYK